MRSSKAWAQNTRRSRHKEAAAITRIATSGSGGALMRVAPPQGGLDVLHRDRLRDVAVEAGCERAAVVFGLPVARHGDEPQRVAERATRAARKLVSIEAGK